MKPSRDPYKVPVQTSKGPGGTALSPGWKIVEENGQMYFVPDRGVDTITGVGH